jgi:hypothetical protein
MVRIRQSQYIMTLRKPCLCLPSGSRSELTGHSSYVKGLPIKIKVDELNGSGEAVTREILSSFQDTYTCEFEELYKCLVEGKPIKTSAEDALDDLRLFEHDV